MDLKTIKDLIAKNASYQRECENCSSVHPEYIIDLLEEILEATVENANEDYRGNRSSSSQRSFVALNNLVKKLIKS